MLGFTQDFITPFALALKASTGQIGLLASLPNLALAISQLGSPFISERLKTRKMFILPVVLIQAFLWLPILLLPQIFDGAGVWWLIALFTAGSVFGALGNPAWGSMMADLVPSGIRGRYFGTRNKIGGMALLGGFLAGGLVLELSSQQVMIGFSVLLGGAMLFRLASAYFLSRMYEPPSRRCPDTFNPFKELKRLPASGGGRLSLYVAAMMMATHIAAPFFTVYLLKDLGFSYAAFVVITASATIFNFLFMGFWGRLADKHGQLKVVRMTSYIIPLVPVLWLGGHSLTYLIVIQAVSGIAWSGFNLASTNLLYESAAPERRTRVIALFNALSGVAICAGALLGGLLAPRLPEIAGYSFLTLFLLSGLLRGSVVVTLLSRITSDGHSWMLTEKNKGSLFAVARPVMVWFIFLLMPVINWTASIFKKRVVKTQQREQKRLTEPHPPWPQ